MFMRLLISCVFLLAVAGTACAQLGPGVSGAIPNGVQRKAPVMGSGGGAGGMNGQLQYNSGGALAGTNGGGDCTWLGPATFTCTKTNGVAFGPLATSTRASFLTGPFTSLVSTGPISITGNQTGGADQISHVSVNGVLNVQAFGADPTDTNDSTAAFNSAIAAACPRTSGTGFCKQAIYVPKGTYKVTQINATNLFYFKMYGDSPIGNFNIIDCEESTNNTGICTDFSGDQYTTVDNIQWDTSVGHAPRAEVLMAKTTIANFGNSQEHDWRNDAWVQNGGDFGVYNYGGEIWRCQMCNWNGNPNVASLFMSLVNTPGVTSPFATLTTGTSSMTTTDLDDVSLSDQNGVPPLMINSGGASLDTFNVSGYCNTGLSGTSSPCIEDYTSTDTGGVTNFHMSNMRHESFGSAPGPLIDMRYGAIWGGNIKATWNPAAPTSGPAAIFGGLLNWTDINIFIFPGNETGAPVVCTGNNVLGDVIHVQYGSPGPVYLPNGCVGATIIDGVEGSGGGTLIRNWLYQSQVTAIANFAGCNSGMEGAFGRANNCSSLALGTTCDGLGSVHAEVMCNGTNWESLGY